MTLTMPTSLSPSTSISATAQIRGLQTSPVCSTIIYRLLVVGLPTRITRSTVLPPRLRHQHRRLRPLHRRLHHRHPQRLTFAVTGTSSFGTTSRSTARTLMPASLALMVRGSRNKLKVNERSLIPPGHANLLGTLGRCRG